MAIHSLVCEYQYVGIGSYLYKNVFSKEKKKHARPTLEHTDTFDYFNVCYRAKCESSYDLNLFVNKKICMRKMCSKWYFRL